MYFIVFAGMLTSLQGVAIKKNLHSGYIHLFITASNTFKILQLERSCATGQACIRQTRWHLSFYFPAIVKPVVILVFQASFSQLHPCWQLWLPG